MANVDYDSNKAHEYYMKHRKLKGRRFTKGFDKTQKEQWSYAKAQLSEQHKQTNRLIVEDKKHKSEELSEKLARQKKEMSERAEQLIHNLKEMLKNMPKEQKALMREKINKMIGDIRNDLKIKKQELTEWGKLKRSALSSDAKKAKESEKKRYELRLEGAAQTIRKKKKVGSTRLAAEEHFGLSGSTYGASSGSISGIKAAKKKKSKKR